MKTDLYSKTIRLAKASGLSVADISRGTGLKVRWLNRLLAGDFKDPGVRKIERLCTFLEAAQQSSDKAA